MSKPNPLDFRALPINDADLIPFYIGSDTSKPFWVSWKDLKNIIAATLPSGSGVLLKTNGVTNPVQTLLNLVAGTNMTISNDGLGNITFSASGGSGSGTVTSVGAGTGMSFATITTSGNVAIDVTKVPYLAAGFSNGFLKWNGSAWIFDNTTYFPNPTGTTSQYIRGDGSLATFPSVGSGTVTSVSATVPAPAIPAFSVSVGTPTTTPALAITANGTASQIVTGDGGLASIATISTVSSIFQEDVYITNTAPIGMEYVPSVGKLYVCNLTSGNVTIFDTTNGDLLGTVSVTNALRIKYIQSINEIWVSSSSLTTITRIDPSSNTSIGTFSVGAAVGSDFLEYSSTKVFLVISAGSGSIRVINPTSFTVTATITTGVPSFPSSMAYNSNPASLQFDKIVITAQNGVFILDPNTNSVSTTVANPSSAFNSGGRILYSATDDKYYATSLSNNRVVVLSIATATTFTALFLGNNLFLNDLKIDETNDLLFTFPLEGGTGQNVLVKVFKKSTMTPIISFRTSCFGGAGSQAGNAAIDILNKRIFVTGRNSVANSTVSVIRYL